MTPCRPIDTVDYQPPEPSAVHCVIDRRLPLRKLRRRIRSVTDRLLAALGEQRGLWLELEALLSDYHGPSEEAFFDLDYEHGYAAGRAAALRALTRQAADDPDTRDMHALADAIRNLTIQADLPASSVHEAFLETAWALALDWSKPCDPSSCKQRRTER